MSTDAAKRNAAAAAVAMVTDGMVLGLGSGSTAMIMVELLGARVRDGLRVTGVPTSERTAALAREAGITLATLDEQPRLDLVIDGADEVQVDTLAMIKGLGGALLREKIVAASAARMVVIVDTGKMVARLGTHSPVPVEIAAFGARSTVDRLRHYRPTLRSLPDGAVFVTDGGNHIADCATGPIDDPAAMADDLGRIAGVLQTGLFLGMAETVVVGHESGVTIVKSK